MGAAVRAAACAVLLVLTSVAGAAGQGQAAPPDNQPPRANPDFLFGQPRGSLGLRGSWVFARAGSDVFDFVRQHLTIDDGAFNAPAFATDLAIAVTPRVDAVFGFEFSQAKVSSEYRNFVDKNRQPITQETRLREANLSGSARVALAPKGRGISRLAWIPSRATPYVGAGGGFLWYEFSQAGDFVEALAPPPQPVFADMFRSKGWTPSAHVFGGVDIRLHRALMGTVEGRYLWADAPLGRSYENFDPIDLAGFRVAAGINVLF